VSERDDRPAGENTTEGQQKHLDEDLKEGAGPGATGAADGTAAAGSLGAVGSARKGKVIPGGSPDPTVGPD